MDTISKDSAPSYHQYSRQRYCSQLTLILTLAGEEEVVVSVVVILVGDEEENDDDLAILVAQGNHRHFLSIVGSTCRICYTHHNHIPERLLHHHRPSFLLIQPYSFNHEVLSSLPR